MFNAFGHRNHHLVKFQRSNLERYADGLFVADHIPVFGIAKTMQREIAHVHSGGDHSVHVVLAPADCMIFSILLLGVRVLTLFSRYQSYRGWLGPASCFLGYTCDVDSFAWYEARYPGRICVDLCAADGSGD